MALTFHNKAPYSKIDNYLIEIGQELRDIETGLGLLIGYMDSQGFMWLDFHIGTVEEICKENMSIE